MQDATTTRLGRALTMVLAGLGMGADVADLSAQRLIPQVGLYVPVSSLGQIEGRGWGGRSGQEGVDQSVRPRARMGLGERPLVARQYRLRDLFRCADFGRGMLHVLVNVARCSQSLGES